MGEDGSCSKFEDRVEVAVAGRDDAVPCLVLVGSALTGGAGGGSSSTGASTPSGPKGPIESSRLSRVVDCARLPCRRGARVFEGAGRGEVVDAGEEGSWIGFEGVESTACLVRSSCSLLGRFIIPEALVASASAALGRLMLDDDLEGTSEA